MRRKGFAPFLLSPLVLILVLIIAVIILLVFFPRLLGNSIDWIRDGIAGIVESIQSVISGGGY